MNDDIICVLAGLACAVVPWAVIRLVGGPRRTVESVVEEIARGLADGSVYIPGDDDDEGDHAHYD